MANGNDMDFAGSSEAQGIVDRHANAALVRYNENMAPIRAAAPTRPLSSITNVGQALTPAQEFAIPPEGGDRVNIKPMSSEELNRGRAAMRTPLGYPTEREHAPESPLGREEFPSGGAIPERAPVAATTSAPAEQGWTHYAEGIDYKLGKENIAGDKAARERVLSEAGAAGRERMDVARGEDIRRTEEAAKSKGGDEFDFNAFKGAMSSIGGKPSRKVQLAVLGHMYDTFQKRMEAQSRLKELGITHGEESPAMIGARSEAKHRDIDSQIKMSKEPAERAKLTAEAAEIQAKAGSYPAQTQYYVAHANYMDANTDLPAIKGYKVQLDAIDKQMKDAIDPNVQKELADRSRDIFDKMNEEVHSNEMTKKYGLPKNPRLNQTHEIPGKGTVRWNGSRWVEAI